MTEPIDKERGYIPHSTSRRYSVGIPLDEIWAWICREYTSGKHGTQAPLSESRIMDVSLIREQMCLEFTLTTENEDVAMCRGIEVHERMGLISRTKEALEGMGKVSGV